ncbi:substrate-binding domain-containing protein [Leucobacter sp. wl10]|uniref:substrate-binding domain-containing protein n=1 Tax=Leucobacter sp. wl10 TaxID=2304677 RepID=UPI0013C2E290|nr:substrate-binding domain-containing protein [Leucobacter sp. wl10]
MNKKHLRGASLLGIAALVAGLAGCSGSDTGSGDDSGGDAKGEFRIALVTGLVSQPFYVDMQRGAEAEAKKLGVELQYEGASQWDPSVQIPVFDSVRATKPDFLLAVPVNDEALLGPLQQFTDEGIPVATVDTDLADKSGRLVNISSDNYAGGELAAEAAAEAIGEKGKVGLLCYNPGITVNDQRREGFEKKLAEYPDVEYVGNQLMNTSSETDQALPPFLRSNPDLDALVTCDGNSGSRSVAILGEANSDVKLVSFDVDADLMTALKADAISALIAQSSEEMGALSVRWAFEYLSGDKPSQDDVTLPFVKATKDNLSDPDVQKAVGSYDK